MTWFNIRIGNNDRIVAAVGIEHVGVSLAVVHLLDPITQIAELVGAAKPQVDGDGPAAVTIPLHRPAGVAPLVKVIHQVNGISPSGLGQRE